MFMHGVRPSEVVVEVDAADARGTGEKNCRPSLHKRINCGDGNQGEVNKQKLQHSRLRRRGGRAFVSGLHSVIEWHIHNPNPSLCDEYCSAFSVREHPADPRNGVADE